MQWFIPFLAITFFAEVYAHYLLHHNQVNFFIYAFYVPFSTVFYTYIFIQSATTQILKKIFAVVATLYIIVNAFYYILPLGFISWRYLIILSGIQITVFACLIFYQYLKTDDLDCILNYTSKLWTIAGLLIFYSGITIVLSLLQYIHINDIKINNEYLYNFIPRYLCILLYGCIAVSFFVWKKPILK